MGLEPAGKSAEEVLDHLLLGSVDLIRGIEWMRERTGISALMGGRHPGAGTRNALLSLDRSQYLEIISLDPTQSAESRTVSMIRDLVGPKLIAWAAKTSDIDLLARSAAKAGLGIEGPLPGSRTLPDGTTLHWKILHILDDYDAVIPFFIEWDPGVLHPSNDSPAGCRLLSFEIYHPQSENVRKILTKLGIAATVRDGNAPALRALLSCPNGNVIL